MEFVPSHVEVLGFFFFIHVNSSSLLFPCHVSPPTSIMDSLPSSNMHADVLSNLKPTSIMVSLPSPNKQADVLSNLKPISHTNH
jgi:hypothetical protein